VTPRHHPLPDLPGVLSASEAARTVAHIADHQLADGNIPWVPGGHTDPWNLVEAAMALDVGGRVEGARAAYDWLSARQRADGAWHWYHVGDEVEHDALDTNVAAYVAVGAWHHHLCTRDRPWLARQWPMVEAAIEFVLRWQAPTGEVAWRGDDPGDGALLTGCSSIHLSLRCALAVAEELGQARPDWELATGALAAAIAGPATRFLDKDRWSMDWYYPVLGGAVRGGAAAARLAQGWSRFVVEGRGVRCVEDRPWVTAAETSELVLTLDAVGRRDDARGLLSWVRFLRSEDGGYWTGSAFEDERWDGPGVLFPREQPTWSSAAVVLAADAVGRASPASRLFTGDALPRGVPATLITPDRGAAPAGSRSWTTD
jgi:hypothetical protein